MSDKAKSTTSASQRAHCLTRLTCSQNIIDFLHVLRIMTSLHIKPYVNILFTAQFYLNNILF